MPAPAVVHNKEKNRFEIPIGDGLALAAYRREGEVIAFTHTEVPEAHEGQGLASRLAEAGLAYARDAGLGVAPHCAFIAAYIRKHPEHRALVVDGFPL